MMTIIGLIVAFVGWAAGVIHYKTIVKKYRNAGARYMPEVEAAYTPLALRREDLQMTQRPRRTGSTVRGQNHTKHTERAAYYRALTLDAPPAPDAAALPDVADDDGAEPGAAQ